MSALPPSSEGAAAPAGGSPSARLRVLVLDNSVATTGAFGSAVAMAEAIRSFADVLFMLPPAPALHATLARQGFRSRAMAMVEIGRSFARLAGYLPALFANGVRLRRLLSSERIDVLVANDYYNLLPAMMRLLGWRGRIVTLVRLLPAHQQPVLNRVWIAAMRRTSTRVVAVSEAVASQLPADLGATVVYFPVGRGLEAIPYSPPSTSDDTGTVTFLYLANYIQGKGQGHALQAFAGIAGAFPGARLRLVGGDMGLAKNAAYRDALVSEVARLDLKAQVDLEGPASDIVAAMQGADVVLNFSESESFSQTCVEAGLMGRPVIATRSGGPQEIVRDGTTGLLVPCGDVEAMQMAMRRLAADPGLRRAMGEAAWRDTRARFGEAGFAATMSRLLTD